MLQAQRPHVIGYLELLWNTAYESGNPQIGDSIDVELACEWPSDEGALTQALLKCGDVNRSGFIDENDDGTFSVHDLYDHAPTYVMKRAEREIQREEKGISLSEIRSAAGKRGAEKRWQLNGKRVANENHLPIKNGNLPIKNGNCIANGRTPTPTPTPTPAPAPTPNNTPPTPHEGDGVTDESFGKFWALWLSPRKNRQKAERAWRRIPKKIKAVIFADLRKRHETEDWTKENRRYRPDPVKYLNGRRWEDDSESADPTPPTMTEREIEEERALLAFEPR